MDNDKPIELTIRDNISGQYLYIPVLPDTISYTNGSALENTVKILNLGNLNFSDGVELDTMEWQSFFPASYDSGYCTTSNIKRPLEYIKIFKNWKDEHTSLQLICPAAGIEQEMELISFSWEFSGFEMDLYYKVSFKELKNVRPVQISVEASGTGILTLQKPKKGPESRPAVTEKTKPITWTVKKGDTLSFIAKKLNISGGWQALYNKNKDTIKNPNLLHIGQVLKL